MIRIILTLAALACASPALAQQDAAKCATVTVSGAQASDLSALIGDAECFGKAAVSASTSQFLRLAKAKELAKAPVVVTTPSPTPTPTPAPLSVIPIASNFDTSASLWSGFPIPGSMAPDNVGAFRFICSPGQLIYGDPILFSGDPAKSHLHQFYGNTLADANSTYATLRTTGESTCSNKLNRSAYWIPALFNVASKVIVPDYLSIYYKRHADGDPACMKEAAKGCADLPPGLRVVSGYDTARMGQKQPENATYTFRCISPGKPSIHHGLMSEAISDCGGAGQVMALINFGNCWTGQLDSVDHRSHLATPQYVGHTYAECPATHPYLIPELTQQIAYTIEASDGAVYFASDKMHGMDMAGGSTFHADYMEGWDPTVRLTWERNCIGKMLNCSDGVLGDGTMMKRGALPLLASPRLVDAPSR